MKILQIYFIDKIFHINFQLTVCFEWYKICAVCDLFPGTVCGDPRFTGADGNIFYFHGKKDQEFCILSDNNFHINAHFIGKHNPEKERDFTWIQALGIVFGDNHKLYIGVEKTITWDDSVDRLVITFNGERIDIPTETKARWAPETAPSLFITRTLETNGIMVELRGVFTIIGSAVPITKKESDAHNYGVTPDDSLAHLDLSFKFHSLSDDVHGILGQTYRPDYVNKLDVRKNMPVMTGVANYSSSTIFATDCAVTRFHGKPKIALVTEKADN
jgi:Root cap